MVSGIWIYLYLFCHNQESDYIYFCELDNGQFSRTTRISWN